jgi:hypothetical protein
MPETIRDPAGVDRWKPHWSVFCIDGPAAIFIEIVISWSCGAYVLGS